MPARSPTQQPTHPHTQTDKPNQNQPNPNPTQTDKQALRSHLVEFRDHELVRGRPAPGGGELLYVPLDAGALRAVLEEMDAAAPQ